MVLLCPILSKLLTCYGIVKVASRIWHLVMKTLGMRHVSFGSELQPQLTFFLKKLWTGFVRSKVTSELHNLLLFQIVF